MISNICYAEIDSVKVNIILSAHFFGKEVLIIECALILLEHLLKILGLFNYLLSLGFVKGKIVEFALANHTHKDLLSGGP